MAITTVFGMTESGKSWLTENKIIKPRDKKIVFDYAHCFSSGEKIAFKDNAQFLKVFKYYSKRDRFYFVHRPPKNSTPEQDLIRFNKISLLARKLGESIGKRVEPDKRILLVIDEADMICSSHFQSRELKQLVNKGRHDNVDALFIARNPNRLHTDIRANASTVITFNLSNAKAIPFFRQNFSKENLKRIPTLPKYHYFVWKDNGEQFFVDHKGNKYD